MTFKGGVMLTMRGNTTASLRLLISEQMAKRDFIARAYKIAVPSQHFVYHSRSRTIPRSFQSEKALACVLVYGGYIRIRGKGDNSLFVEVPRQHAGVIEPPNEPPSPGPDPRTYGKSTY